MNTKAWKMISRLHLSIFYDCLSLSLSIFLLLHGLVDLYLEFFYTLAFAPSPDDVTTPCTFLEVLTNCIDELSFGLCSHSDVFTSFSPCAFFSYSFFPLFQNLVLFDLLWLFLAFSDGPGYVFIPRETTRGLARSETLSLSLISKLAWSG